MSESRANTGQSLTRRDMYGEASPGSPAMFSPSRFFGLSPFALMREFTDAIDRTITGRGDGGAALDAWAPAIDVQQCNGTLTVTAELPGLKREDVKVELTNETLIIEGERKREHKPDHEGFHRWERQYGQFYRAIPLPEGTRTDQMKAELNDGVLKVTVPVLEMKNKLRQIPIEGGRTN